VAWGLGPPPLPKPPLGHPLGAWENEGGPRPQAPQASFGRFSRRRVEGLGELGVLGPPSLPKPPLGTLTPPNNTAQKELGVLGGLGSPLFPSHPWCTPLVHGRTREAQDPKPPKPLLGGVQEGWWRGAWGASGAWGLGPPPLPKPPLGTLPPPNNTAQKELGVLGGLGRPLSPSHPWCTPPVHGRTREAQDPKPPNALLGGFQEGWWRGLGSWGCLGRRLSPSHPWGLSHPLTTLPKRSLGCLGTWAAPSSQATLGAPP